MPYRRTPWIFFGLALLLAAYYVLHTSPALPPLVALPPHLSGTHAMAALLAFFLVTAGWMFSLMVAFRRP